MALITLPRWFRKPPPLLILQLVGDSLRFMVRTGGKVVKSGEIKLKSLNARTFDVAEAEGIPEVVAKCKFHMDQDLTVWKAVQIARWYNDALFVPEANSLKKENPGGDFFLTILDEIVNYYPNIYARNEDQIEKLRSNVPLKYGFHTNTATKKLIITFLNKALREILYLERDEETCDEMAFYEEKDDGSFGAIEGQHDDEVMTTAIGVYVCHRMPAPVILSNTPSASSTHRYPKSESTF